MRQRARSTAATAVVLIAGSVAGIALAAKLASFPGAEPLRSPDGHLVVYSIPPSDGGGGNHRLVVADKGGGGAVRDLLEFGRHVSVSWAPDSKHVAVTDYAGSDEADCYIFDSETGTRVDVGEKAKSSGEFEASKADQHRYIECGRWRRPDVVAVTTRSWGDANPRGLVQHAEFSLKRGFIKGGKGKG